MSDKDNGGPAFPIHPDLPNRVGCINSESDAGMSLRDWFAGQALAGILATYQGPKLQLPLANDAADWAYAYADAMLEARNG